MERIMAAITATGHGVAGAGEATQVLAEEAEPEPKPPVEAAADMML